MDNKPSLSCYHDKETHILLVIITLCQLVECKHQICATVADIRAEPAVEISFVLLIIEVNHLGQYN